MRNQTLVSQHQYDNVQPATVRQGQLQQPATVRQGATMRQGGIRNTTQSLESSTAQPSYNQRGVPHASAAAVEWKPKFREVSAGNEDVQVFSTGHLEPRKSTYDMIDSEELWSLRVPSSGRQGTDYDPKAKSSLDWAVVRLTI